MIMRTTLFFGKSNLLENMKRAGLSIIDLSFSSLMYNKTDSIKELCKSFKSQTTSTIKSSPAKMVLT